MGQGQENYEMPRKQRNIKKQATPKKYKFIVEGSTEENYINLLKELYRFPHLAKPIINSGGGNAQNVLQKAKKQIAKYGNELFYVIWFDADGYFEADKALKQKLEQNESVDIYISKPCTEHWLLAHFQKINLNENSPCEIYEKQKLPVYIPNYAKNDYKQLATYIDKNRVEVAMQNYPKLAKIPEKFQNNI